MCGQRRTYFLFSSSFEGMLCVDIFPTSVTCRVLTAVVRSPIGISWFPGIVWVKEDREGRFPCLLSMPLCVSQLSWLSWMGGRRPQVAPTVSVQESYPAWLITSNPLELASHWSSFRVTRDWVRKASLRMTYDFLDFCVPVALVPFCFIKSFYL